MKSSVLDGWVDLHTHFCAILRWWNKSTAFRAKRGAAAPGTKRDTVQLYAGESTQKIAGIAVLSEVFHGRRPLRASPGLGSLGRPYFVPKAAGNSWHVVESRDTNGSVQAMSFRMAATGASFANSFTSVMATHAKTAENRRGVARQITRW